MNSDLVSNSPVICPRSDCPSRLATQTSGPNPGHRVRKRGSFRRADSLKRIHRYDCLSCGRSFSEATLEPECWQKKRHWNEAVYKLLCSGISQRRLALILGLSRTTITRKFLFLARQARREHERWLQTLAQEERSFEEVQFDEMESFEHTKCKPLSIALMVCKKSRQILGFEVSPMPANGPLAQLARRKYGPRPDGRAAGADRLFQRLSPVVHPQAVLESDQNPKYPAWLRPHFPEITHQAFKGRRGCVVGQGELKKIGFDPLFSFNHTAAMIRANVNRLFRRTWCTTKRLERLAAHLDLYVQFHNRTLLSDAPI